MKKAIAEKRDPSQLARRALNEFEQFEDWVNDSLKSIREGLKEKKAGLLERIDGIEADINKLKLRKRQLIKGPVPQRDKKLKEMRMEFNKLEKCDGRVEEYKKVSQSTMDYLEQELTSIDTRVFTVKQQVGREIEAHI